MTSAVPVAECVALAAIALTWVLIRPVTGGDAPPAALAYPWMLTATAVTTLLVFLALALPDALCWSGVLRAHLAAAVASVAIGARCLAAFGPGARGQDAAMLMAGLVLVAVSALGTAVASGALLIRDVPAVGDFQAGHPRLTGALVLASALPIGIGYSLLIALLLGLVGGMLTAMRS